MAYDVNGAYAATTQDIKDFVDFVMGPMGDEIASRDTWRTGAKTVLDGLCNNGQRYCKSTGQVQVRVSSSKDDEKLLWAALLNPQNQDGGAYGGTSVVLFASKDHPSLLTFCVGTQGLAPDEKILGSAGHARKLDAIRKYINRVFGGTKVIAWAKDSPCRTDVLIPNNVVSDINRDGDAQYALALKPREKGGYGKEIYAVVNVTGLQKEQVAVIAKLFLDLYFEDYDVGTKRAPVSLAKDVAALHQEYQSEMMPHVTADELERLLNARKYIIVEGPPGTGKTKIAKEVATKYNGTFLVQFHPNMTYEQFMGGLFPDVSNATSAHEGFSFRTRRGALLDAIAVAQKPDNADKKYLLIIDEINRADLSRVLGEAIFLFEPHACNQRPVQLGYKFDGFEGGVVMPPNLHVIGTMNSSDRSIAILDIAIRRRFGFKRLYPQMSVVNELGDDFSRGAFSELLMIFVNHASDECFKYLPGHSYFIVRQNVDIKMQIQAELLPLLQEYIDQGFVSGFEEEIRAYINKYQAV